MGRSGRRHRDLLTDHRADEHLVRVGGTRHTDARDARDERSELGVRRQRRVDGERVGVEVEEAPGARDEHGQVAQVGEPGAQPHAPGVVEAEREPGRPAGQADRAGR